MRQKKSQMKESRGKHCSLEQQCSDFAQHWRQVRTVLKRRLPGSTPGFLTWLVSGQIENLHVKFHVTLMLQLQEILRTTAQSLDGPSAVSEHWHHLGACRACRVSGTLQNCQGGRAVFTVRSEKHGMGGKELSAVGALENPAAANNISVSPVSTEFSHCLFLFYDHIEWVFMISVAILSSRSAQF